MNSAASGLLRLSLFVLLFGQISCRSLDDPKVSPASITEYTQLSDWSHWQASFTSINVWGVPVAGKHQDERMPLLGKKIRSLDTDIALIQEAWTKSTRSKINREVRAPYVTHFKRGGLYGSGVLYLTHWPVSRKSFRPFKLFGDWKNPEYFTTKGIGMTTLNVSGLTLSIFNTHLMADYTERKGPRHKFTAEWKMQLFEVLVHIIEQTDSDAFLIAGDFNISFGNEEYAFWKKMSSLEGTYWEESEGACTSCRENTYKTGKGKDTQLDYVFLSPRLKLVDAYIDYTETYPFRGRRRHLSDHYGITGKVAVKSQMSGIDEFTARQNFKESLEDLIDELENYKSLPLLEEDGPDWPLEDRIEYSIALAEDYLKALSREPLQSSRLREIRRRQDEYFQLFRQNGLLTVTSSM